MEILGLLDNILPAPAHFRNFIEQIFSTYFCEFGTELFVTIVSIFFIGGSDPRTIVLLLHNLTKQKNWPAISSVLVHPELQIAVLLA